MHIEQIYYEEAVGDHPVAQRIFARYSQATKIECHRYGEVFNRKGQNFRLQKKQPALILARKQGECVLESPKGFGIGGENNYYFSHILNCPFDCRYCFLQGMYSSGNYVLFVNYEAFQESMESLLERHLGEDVYFFSGYNGDSLALEPMTGFVKGMLPFFRKHPNAILELRTKSIQIRELLRQQPIDNCVVAFTLTPDTISRALEHRAPPLHKRIEAMVALQQQGWKLGLRFDPVIYCEEYREQYRALFSELFEAIDPELVHSASLGPFRLPKGHHDKMINLYPKEQVLAGRLQERKGIVSYSARLEEEMISFCLEELEKYMNETQIFSYLIEKEVAR